MDDPTGDPLPRPQNFLLVAVVFEGGLVVVAVGLGWLLGVAPAAGIDWDLAAAGWGVLASGPLLAMLWVCVRWPVRPLVEITRVVDETLVPLFRPCGLLELAVISALAGLGEEMLFRGVVQVAAAGWVGGELGNWVGLILASILFGLAHPITRTYALLAGLIGLYLGGLFLATDNLLVPIVTHAVYDFLALVYLVRIRGQRSRT